jgi:hypothetical protein
MVLVNGRQSKKAASEPIQRPCDGSRPFKTLNVISDSMVYPASRDESLMDRKTLPEVVRSLHDSHTVRMDRKTLPEVVRSQMIGRAGCLGQDAGKPTFGQASPCSFALRLALGFKRYLTRHPVIPLSRAAHANDQADLELLSRGSEADKAFAKANHFQYALV